MKTLLVTGGAGFIGSNFIRYMLATYPNYRIVNLDALTYAGNLKNLVDLKENPHYIFVHGSITDKEKVEELFIKYDFLYVINFAAESHVDRSISDSSSFITTNVLGTQTLLDVAKQHWKIDTTDPRCITYKNHVRFLQISTDEVYGSLKAEGSFRETHPLAPNNPYSASKASADMFVHSYYKTYHMPILITRSSNNYGPCQHQEKLIPLMIQHCIQEKPLPVYGNGLQVRDWIHVKDHCIAVDTVLHKGTIGEVYNIGSETEKSNIDIIHYLLHALGKSPQLISYVQDRLGHDTRYAIDASKLRNTLHWKPSYTFEDGLNETIAWYKKHLS